MIAMTTKLLRAAPVIASLAALWGASPASANVDHFKGECISPSKAKITSSWSDFPNRKNWSDVHLYNDNNPVGHEVVHWSGPSFERSYDVGVTPGTHHLKIVTVSSAGGGPLHASQTFALTCSKPAPPPTSNPTPAPPSQQQQNQQQTTNVVVNNTIIVQAPAPSNHGHHTKLVKSRWLVVFARHGELRYVRISCGGRTHVHRHLNQNAIKIKLDLRGLGRTVRLHVVIRTSTGKRIFITIDVHRDRGGTIVVDP